MYHITWTAWINKNILSVQIRNKYNQYLQLYFMYNKFDQLIKINNYHAIDCFCSLQKNLFISLFHIYLLWKHGGSEQYLRSSLAPHLAPLPLGLLTMERALCWRASGPHDWVQGDQALQSPITQSDWITGNRNLGVKNKQLLYCFYAMHYHTSQWEENITRFYNSWKNRLISIVVISLQTTFIEN